MNDGSCYGCGEARYRYDENSGDITHTRCMAVNDEYGWPMEYEGLPLSNWRPEWCPKKQKQEIKMPEREDMLLGTTIIKEATKRYEDPRYRNGWKHGWNACLDELEALNGKTRE